MSSKNKKKTKHNKLPSVTEVTVTKKKKNPKDDLSEDELKVLKEFQVKLEDITDSQDKKFCDIPCLIRYLVARDFDLKKSEDLLRGTLKWRKEFGVDSLNGKDLMEEGSTGKNVYYWF